MNKTVARLKEETELRLDAQYAQLKKYQDTQTAIEISPFTFLGRMAGHFFIQAVLYTLVAVLSIAVVFSVAPDLGEAAFEAIGMDAGFSMQIVELLSGIGLVLCVFLLLFLIKLRSKIAMHNDTVDSLSELLKEVIAHEKDRIEQERKNYLNLLRVMDEEKNKPDSHR